MPCLTCRARRQARRKSLAFEAQAQRGEGQGESRDAGSLEAGSTGVAARVNQETAVFRAAARVAIVIIAIAAVAVAIAADAYAFVGQLLRGLGDG